MNILVRFKSLFQPKKKINELIDRLDTSKGLDDDKKFNTIINGDLFGTTVQKTIDETFKSIENLQNELFKNLQVPKEYINYKKTISKEYTKFNKQYR